MDYRGIINEIRHHRYLTTILVTLIIGSNAWTIVGETYNHDKEPDYWGLVQYAKFDCNLFEIPNNSEKIQRNPLKYWLHCASYQITGSIKTFPLIFNIGVMPMVYLVGSRLTNDRLVGLISLVAFINNPLYRDWWDSATYDNTWTFFLLLSVLLLYKRGSGGIFSYIVSGLAKTISLMYLPAWLYTHYTIRKNRVDVLTIIFGISVLFVSILPYTSPFGSVVGFFPERWEDAVYRNISVLWQVIPIIALFVVLSRNFIPKNKVIHEKLVWVWIGCALIQNPIVYLFTLQDTYSYRYAPLAAFLSIFIGMTLVNMGNWWQERQLAKA